MLQNFSKIVIVSLIKLIYITCNDELGNLTDLSRCILSHLGLEYRGEIQKTESGVPCQAWDSEKPVHKVNISFIDEKFSDFSKKNAMNYCRNPSLHPDGPWCYSMEKNNINETCMIPLCSFSECKATGPGMEYSGKHKRGLSV
ncbi:plasminogen-like isoform X6 [Agrilus planipennis]|uniref:Plasminogen-like isoform X6 n=1 Tax=Agrilus planipennis TaxID=224129 RepID=A0A1W4XKM8_AGRPL|nr:plasminogen-like isoform X6 [Agrilus planipennis]XP_018333327.1 plasminogen-like isoform X6 [Agrilus planipennis]